MNTKSIRLYGLKVLNTRPVEDAKELSAQIRAAGGVSVELPTISISACNLIWLEYIKDLSSIQQIIFISKNAVRYFFSGLESACIKLPKDISITCIGPGTAKILNNYNIDAHYVPETNTSEHLLNLDNFTNVCNQNILLVKGVGGRETIGKELQTRGANLTIIDVYERLLPSVNHESINAIWQQDAIDIIIYTSKQAMINAIEIFPSRAKKWLLSKPSIVISKRLAEHAKNLGFEKIIQTTYPDIIVAIEGQNK